MAEQVIFTSCRRSLDCDSQGIQTWNHTDGMDPETVSEMAGMGGYSLENTPYKTVLDDPSLYRSYPKAFRYIHGGNGDRLFSKSVFLSADWSGTRFGANYLSHSIRENAISGYPIEYIDSDSFITEIDNAAVSSPDRPEPLPRIPLELKERRMVNRETVSAFMSEHGTGDVGKMLNLLVANHSRIVIADQYDKVPFWIAAVTMSLPRKLAETVSFSTFGKLVDNGTPMIVPMFSREPGFRIVEAENAADDPLVDAYFGDTLDDPLFLKAFTEFLDSCPEPPKSISELPEYYLMYLVSRGNGSHLRFSDDRKIVGMLSSDPKRYGETVLCNILNAGFDGTPDEELLSLYRKSIDLLDDRNDAVRLRKRYTDLMYARIRTSSDADVLKQNRTAFMDTMKDAMLHPEDMPMDTIGEIYIAMHCWKAGHDPEAAKALGRARMEDIGPLVKLMREEDMSLTRWSAPDSVLSESIRGRMADIVFSDIDSMSDTGLMELIDEIKDDDMDRYRQVFDSVVRNPKFGRVLDRCLDDLPMRGQDFTYPDAVEICRNLGDACPYEALLRSMVKRRLKTSEDIVQSLIWYYNLYKPPMDFGDRHTGICRMINDSFPDYHLAIGDEVDLIGAAIMMDRVRNGVFEPVTPWNYLPPAKDIQNYARAMAPYLTEASMEQITMLASLFDRYMDDFVYGVISYYSENKGSIPDPKPAVTIMAVALESDCRKPTLDLGAELLFRNRKYRFEDIVPELRRLSPNKSEQLLIDNDPKKKKESGGWLHRSKNKTEEPGTREPAERPEPEEPEKELEPKPSKCASIDVSGKGAPVPKAKEKEPAKPKAEPARTKTEEKETAAGKEPGPDADKAKKSRFRNFFKK